MPKVRKHPTKKAAKSVPSKKLSATDLVRAVTKNAKAVPGSTPSAGSGPAPSSHTESKAMQGIRNLPADSKVREKAMHILSMKLNGHSTAEIAESMKLSPATVKQYIYIAGVNGWLAEQGNWADPADKAEFELLPKAVDELKSALDNSNVNPKTNMPIKTQVALKIADGMLFPKFQEQAATAQQPLVALQVNLQTIDGIPMREGTTGGNAKYIDAEVSNG